MYLYLVFVLYNKMYQIYLSSANIANLYRSNRNQKKFLGEYALIILTQTHLEDKML